jgi:hypothetical protein
MKVELVKTSPVTFLLSLADYRRKRAHKVIDKKINTDCSNYFTSGIPVLSGSHASTL